MPPFRLAVLLLAASSAFAGQLPQTYTCGSAAAKSAKALTAQTAFTPDSAGFDLSSTPTVTGGACTSGTAFFFSVPLAEGSYRVTVTLGGPQAATTTVRAEARRLMLEKISTAANKTATRTFDVNLRVPDIYSISESQTSGKTVKLKPREIGNLDWDRKLTLEFNGDHPSVRSITIAPVPPKTPTIYLAGDSTVVDQDIEPWAAWGQMLPRFFSPGVVVANHAESGETLRSFVSEQRFAKIFSLIKPGDYLFMQFNHNDQKTDPKTGQPVVPIEMYQRLLTEYIVLTRKVGATPVLVTSMNRRTFDDTGDITNSLAGYPDAMREVARDQHVTLIDLNAMSKTLFEALGPQASMKAFMHYPANSLPNQPEAISDDTHFNSYGAYELARAVVHGIRQSDLPIKSLLTRDLPDFDPAHPDPLGTFFLPQTPIPTREDTTEVPQI